MNVRKTVGGLFIAYLKENELWIIGGLALVRAASNVP